MSRRSILVCEPQCVGFEHVPLNSALLQTVLLAYPEDEVSFRAEPDHLGRVRETLVELCGRDAARVRWETASVPPRRAEGLRRAWGEGAFWRPLPSPGAAPPSPLRFVLLCSISEPGLLRLKLAPGRFQVPVLVALHSRLGTVLGRQPRNPWRALLSWRRLLTLPPAGAIHYLVLGPSIAQNLEATGLRVRGGLHVIEHPYLWPEPPPGLPERAPVPLRFGYFGVGARGFASFYDCAREVRAEAAGPLFALVGFLAAAERTRGYDPELVDGLATAPLTRAEYTRRARELSYAVWTGPQDHYALAASASFLDSLAYVRPGIYLRNPYVEHYCRELGDIGYVCDSTAEMSALILGLEHDFPLARYRRQCQNILAGRTRFAPAQVAPRLREIVAEASAAIACRGGRPASPA